MNLLPAMLVVFWSAGICLGAPPQEIDQDESIPHPTDPRKRWVAGPHQPLVGASDYGLDTILRYSDSRIHCIELSCSGAKVPLDEKQLQSLRTAATDALKREMKGNPEFIWLLGNLIVDEAGSGPFAKRTRAQFRLIGAIGARHLALDRRISLSLFDRVRAIGSAEQWTATEYCRNQAASYVRDDVVDKLRKHFELRRKGEFTATDIKSFHLDMKSSEDPSDIPLPALKPYILNFLRSRLITHWVRYRLDEKQMISAEAVIDDCTARADKAFAAAEKDLRKLWVDVAIGLIEPEKAKVPWREAVWRFRQAAERVMLPFSDEIDKRLDALVTTEQRVKARAAPPKPEWLVFKEELEDAWAAKIEKSNLALSTSTQPSSKP